MNPTFCIEEKCDDQVQSEKDSLERALLCNRSDVIVTDETKLH